MVIEELHERVAVLGKFEGGQVNPVVLRWQGRRYWVQKVNLHHVEPRGGDQVHYFAVTTDMGDCTLAYSRNDLSWMLEEVSFAG